MESGNIDLKDITILLLDDDRLSSEHIAESLRGYGARVHIALTPSDAARLLTDQSIDVILASLRLANEEGLRVIGEYKRKMPHVLFYLLTEENYSLVEPIDDDVKSILDDYFQKPLDIVRFASLVGASFGRPRTIDTALSVIEPLATRARPYFIFRSYPMRLALSNLPEIAASRETVLISGETGTGKELVARAIHMLSRRSSGPFVPVNCGAIPESLIESELFGHEKGAFTGALRARKGKFESASRGTIFLDEIGDMPLSLQARLLRVLEDHEVQRVGGERRIPINIRVIAASNIDLEGAVKNGLFRSDLYYRLNVLRIHLPPLRERKDDVPVLAQHFLERVFEEVERPAPYPTLTPETIFLMQRYPWRGNVRELRNVMTRVATLLPRDTRHIFPLHIEPHLEDFASEQTRTDSGPERAGLVIPRGTSLEKAEALMIDDALRETDGNRTRAAKRLGISVRTLRRKLNRKPAV